VVGFASYARNGNVTARLATTVLLIRHAHTDAIGLQLCGRSPGVHLSARGRAEAARLGGGLAAESIAAIYSSPLERAVETAAAIASHQRTRMEIRDELSEIDFGDWTGKTFAELEHDQRWRVFNTRRAIAPVPHGENAPVTQARIVAAIDTLAAAHEGERIAIVSHGDPLRYALLHFGGLSLDRYEEIEILPASISALSWEQSGVRLLYVNDRRFADGIVADRRVAPGVETIESVNP
jgi:probable phosphoglycerate mutase